jgi:hypothetical protein
MQSLEFPRPILFWGTDDGTLRNPRDVVSLSFDYTPDSSADALPIETFEHRRFLRVERSVKKLTTPERDALAGDTIKACGCLKVWWDQGLTRGQHDV